MSLGNAIGGPDRAAWWARLRERYDESPFHHLLGLHLVSVEDGRAEVELRDSAGVYNRAGVIAGGAIGTMIDSVIVQATLSRLVEADRTVTIELKINYIAPARDGRLLARGTLLHLGGTTAVAEARVTDARGGVVAVGLGTVAVRRAAGGDEQLATGQGGGVA